MATLCGARSLGHVCGSKVSIACSRMWVDHLVRRATPQVRRLARSDDSPAHIGASRDIYLQELIHGLRDRYTVRSGKDHTGGVRRVTESG